MQPRPLFDRDLLIPIAVGIVSILGLAWILLTNDRSESTILTTVEPTAIPFDISPFVTQMRTPRPSATPPLEETSPGTTETGLAAYPGPPEETAASAGSLMTETRSIPSDTATPEHSFPSGKYDNTDPNIAYDRHWTFRMNPGTENAYKGTLHISSGIGSEVSFHFTGHRLHLGYQRGRNFGTVTVLIDGQPYRFHEQAFDRIWRSPELAPGLHSVRIIHESGESVNLDYIEVVD